ncbi:MAG: bacterial proteasome activator family protein [Actinomycetes bacterium]
MAASGSQGPDLNDPTTDADGVPQSPVVPAPEAATEGGPAQVITRSDDDTPGRPIVELVEQPAKVMRIGSMIKQLLDEVRSAPLDDASRSRLKQIYERSIIELEDGLAPELVHELDRLTLPFSRDATPSDAELRIVQAQLVGWLEGLFHGIQTALFAQQMQAQAQLEEMRRRAIGPADEHGMPGKPGSGPYL